MMRRIGLPRERRREMPLPQLARRRVAEAAVDERAAVAFVEQPEVDVVERERQRHPQPQQPGATSIVSPGAGGAANG